VLFGAGTGHGGIDGANRTVKRIEYKQQLTAVLMNVLVSTRTTVLPLVISGDDDIFGTMGTQTVSMSGSPTMIEETKTLHLWHESMNTIGGLSNGGAIILEDRGDDSVGNTENTGDATNDTR
jgi:hypothetical protein